jgi:hypothetical protein
MISVASAGAQRFYSWVHLVGKLEDGKGSEKSEINW